MKDFTSYYLFKIQPNALLIWQNFIICKKWVLQQGDSQTKIVALRAIGQRKVYFLGGFRSSLVQRQKTNYKAHENTSLATWNLMPHDERLVLNLLRGRSRSIGGDLDVGEEGFEQTIVTLQSLHHGSVGYQHMCTWVDLAKKAYPYKFNREHKQEQERMQLNLQMNVLAHECGALQTVERQNCSWQINLSKTL
jgi:hypothetical protein